MSPKVKLSLATVTAVLSAPVIAMFVTAPQTQAARVALFDAGEGRVVCAHFRNATVLARKIETINAPLQDIHRDGYATNLKSGRRISEGDLRELVRWNSCQVSSL